MSSAWIYRALLKMKLSEGTPVEKKKRPALLHPL